MILICCDVALARRFVKCHARRRYEELTWAGGRRQCVLLNVSDPRHCLCNYVARELKDRHASLRQMHSLPSA